MQRSLKVLPIQSQPKGAVNRCKNLSVRSNPAESDELTTIMRHGRRHPVEWPPRSDVPQSIRSGTARPH